MLEWYWDPKAEEEVCITKGGHEYMRFSRETAKISYCKGATESFAGEEGMHGTTVDEHDIVASAQYIKFSQVKKSSQHSRKLNTGK